MDVKLFDSERRVMQVLWHRGDTPARAIAAQLNDELGWNINTTYTLIKRCIAKGTIRRSEPNFLCHALISQAEVQQAETQALIEKVYEGSVSGLFAALLGKERLTDTQIKRLKDIVDEWE